MPGLPTIAETVPGYEASSWLGILAPAATPRPIIDRLNAAINKGLDDATIRKRLAALGVERVGGTPEAFGSYLRAKVEETDKDGKGGGAEAGVTCGLRRHACTGRREVSLRRG